MTFLDEKYPDKIIFKETVANYFSENKLITIPGLAESLNVLVSHLAEYPPEGPLFGILQFASLKCENYLINAMIKGEIPPVVGATMFKLYFSARKNIDPNDKDDKVAKDVVKDILLDNLTTAADRIKATDQIFKLEGSYAAEKTEVNVAFSLKRLAEETEELLTTPVDYEVIE